MTARNDDLGNALDTIGNTLNNPTVGFAGGWLTPLFAWAFYSQNGVVKSVVNRFATLMTKAGWDYAGADQPYNWATVQSDLETLRLQAAMRLATIWSFVFGGAAIFLDVDDADRPLHEELKTENIRKLRRLIPMSALGLRPEPGKNYATATYFTGWHEGKQLKYHRSRLIIIVAQDVPPSLGYHSAGFINSSTGWPASWLEGIYRSHTDWTGAERDTSRIIKTKSLLYIVLTGLRQAEQNPDSDESAALVTYLENIAKDLSNESVLFLDHDDRLDEVERSATGLNDLVDGKKGTFVADTGTPSELVLMVSTSSLGNNNGPIDSYHDVVDGMRVDALTHVVERVTDIVLHLAKRSAQIIGEPIEVPTRYTVKWRPVAEATTEQKADAREKNSRARKNDIEGGVPEEVMLGDPDLSVIYPDMANYRETKAKEAEAARLAEAAGGPKRPEDDLVSASAVSQRLGISRGTLIKHMHEGAFSGRKVGARWKFYWSEVEAWLETLESTPEDTATEDRLDSGLGLSEHDKFGSVFGASEAMREIFAVLEIVAPSDLAVLITGESGTGKEGVARGLHGDRDGPFVAVNCGSFGDDATGVQATILAAGQKARDGTLFLDEVGELSAHGQASLLRVLGELKDVRVVSATWRDVYDEWSFRLDLLMRLAGVEVEIPPLRERGDDVMVLAGMFYDGYAKANGWPMIDKRFAADAVAALGMYTWPGNVRELKSAVERGALFAGQGRPVAAANLQLRVGPR